MVLVPQQPKEIQFVMKNDELASGYMFDMSVFCKFEVVSVLSVLIFQMFKL